MVQVNQFAKQKKRNTDTEKKCMDTKGKGEWDGLGEWGWHVYATVCEVDAWWGPPVEYRVGRRRCNMFVGHKVNLKNAFQYTLGVGFPGAQTIRNPPTVRETWVWSLGWADPLEGGIATHSSILGWRIPMDRKPGGLQSMGSQRVRHDWAIKHNTYVRCRQILFDSTCYLE